MPLQTPSQTVGPFFHFALPRAGWEIVAGPDAKGERIELVGTVFDGDGVPVSDALIEVWQANAAGRYEHPEDGQDKPLDPAFHGFGRCPTAADGSFRFLTVKPGRVPGRGNSLQAPHVNVSILGRGLLKRLATRIYFEDSPENAEDPVLNLIEDPARRATLVAVRDGVGEWGTRYRLDLRLQGAGETVFFAC